MEAKHLVSFQEMNLVQKKTFEQLAHEYSMVLQSMNLFIEVNDLDYDEIWNEANRVYDEDMTYAPNLCSSDKTSILSPEGRSIK